MPATPLKLRKLNRIVEYDYSQNGYYFVTVCVQNREERFGEIKNEAIVLNKCGEIVEQQWLWLEQHFPYIRSDEFVVMPNHFHGILVIDYKDDLMNDLRRDNPRIVPTTDYHRRHNLLSKTMNAFKTTSSKLIHRAGLTDFAWQRSFYDHIIHDETGLEKIREYIRNNPLQWELDKDNPENLYM